MSAEQPSHVKFQKVLANFREVVVQIQEENESLKSKVGKLKMPRRAALICLEGVDRVGKSTLGKRLVDHLNHSLPGGNSAKLITFPNRSTFTGKQIDTILKNSEIQVDHHAIHLLFTVNRWETQKDIRDIIARGTHVIMDRYSYSGIAYGSAKGLDPKWCRDVEKGLPKPDLVIYLELSKEAQYRREGFGDERYETKEFQENVREQYQSLIEENWLKINVDNKGPEQVLAEVILPVKRCINLASSSPLLDLNFE